MIGNVLSSLLVEFNHPLVIFLDGIVVLILCPADLTPIIIWVYSHEFMFLFVNRDFSCFSSLDVRVIECWLMSELYLRLVVLKLYIISSYAV